jgi:5'-nucleotidase
MSDRRVLAFSLLIVLSLANCGQPASPAPVMLHLLAIGDFHGNLRPPAPLTGAPPDGKPVSAGGIDALAALVLEFRARHQHTLLVSAGDLIGASPLVSGLFHDEPTIEAMNRLGLDLSAVGNHEFDEGADELRRMQTGGCHPSGKNTCRGADVGTPVPFEGARFTFLAANVRTPSGATLFPPYAVRDFEGVRVAFIGIPPSSTPAIVDRSGIQGLRFDEEAATVNALVPELRAQGIEAIVVLLHEGGTVTGPEDASTLNGCAGELEGSPLERIVSALDEAVDLVVAGHSHDAYVCRLQNAAGRRIVVTAAHEYGRAVTEIALALDPATRDVASATATNHVVTRPATVPTGDSALERLVRGYEVLAEPLANRVIGRIGTTFSRERNDAGESALGALIADGQLESTRGAGAQIAFMNPGGIRASLDFKSSAAREGDGRVTYGEAFTVQPFGNTLVTVTLTGRDLHDLLEQQFRDCNGQRGTKVLGVSAGFQYSWSASAPPCSKVNRASMRLDGRPLDPEGAYRVTINSFLAGGGDDFSVLLRATEATGGVVDLDALAAWFGTRQVMSPHGTPRVRRTP